MVYANARRLHAQHCIIFEYYLFELHRVRDRIYYKVQKFMAEQHQNHGKNLYPVEYVQIVVSVILYQISAVANQREYVKCFRHFTCKYNTQWKTKVYIILFIDMTYRYIWPLPARRDLLLYLLEILLAYLNNISMVYFFYKIVFMIFEFFIDKISIFSNVLLKLLLQYRWSVYKQLIVFVK